MSHSARRFCGRRFVGLGFAFSRVPVTSVLAGPKVVVGREEHRRQGRLLAVWRDGKAVWIPAIEPAEPARFALRR